jgi:CheY-like chemotaxis protein
MLWRGSSAKVVLVVEDDPSIGELIAAVLMLEGFEPVVVRDGEHALRTVRSVSPDVITLDLDMPGVDGRAVLRSLRCDAESREVPVVVVSANSDRLSTGERKQVVRTLSKPFEVGELVQAVSSAAAN